jgi:AcrR family transcriptional regulator
VTAAEPDSPRKQELLRAAYTYVLGNGLADMSLRPLAKAIGSSPRVLLFLFGSKEGLIRALLARAREDELRVLAGRTVPPRTARLVGRGLWPVSARRAGAVDGLRQGHRARLA